MQESSYVQRLSKQLREEHGEINQLVSGSKQTPTGNILPCVPFLVQPAIA